MALSRLLIVGCGYLGSRVAKLSLSQGWTVHATTRHSPARINAIGATPLILDWNDPRTLADLPEVDAVLVAVAHDRRSGVDREASQVGGFRRLMRAIDARHDRQRRPHVVYISTTGVYHQTGGVWVDESSPTHPTRDGGQAHLRAESVLRQCRGNDGYTILRLSGIYGPNRVPRAADVRAGRPIASPRTGYLNLIHVDDAASAVMACWHAGESRQRMYVVSDDAPVIRESFYRQIAKQTLAPEPTFIEPGANSGVGFRSETNKRVWNRAFKRDLVHRLRFPTHVEGLADVLRDHHTV